MKRSHLALALALLVVFLPVACAPTVRDATVIDDKSAGRSVEMRAGGTLDVSLEGNPTTGYMWEAASVDSAVLKQVGEREFTSNSQALGAGGNVRFRFRAVAPGQTRLKLIYHRPFEKNVPPEKTFEVNVVVR